MTGAQRRRSHDQGVTDLKVKPQAYADYRPVFETKRLNVTHVRIHPGETVPTHTHVDEDQVYYVATGTGFVVLAAPGLTSPPAAAS